MKNLANNVLAKVSILSLIVSMFLIGLPINVKAASAGVLDKTFSGDGRVSTNISGNDWAKDVAIQPDGKIVVVGGTNQRVVSDKDFFVVRYDTNGTLDRTFGTAGKVTTHIGGQNAEEYANAVAIQTDGKIVIVGYINEVNNPNLDGRAIVLRYNPNGSLDLTFGSNGFVTFHFGNSTHSEANAIDFLSDGTYAIAGSAFIPGGNNFGVANMLLNGQFGSNTTVDFGGDDIGYDVAVQSNDKIVVGGKTSPTTSVIGDYAALRINKFGVLDTTFDTDGKVTTDINGSDIALSVTINVLNKITLGGRTGTLASLVRYNADGSLDTTFDGDGKVTSDLNVGGSAVIKDIELVAGGKIIAGYSTSTGNGGPFGINAVRYNSNGSIDQTFGFGGGITTTSIEANDETNAIAVSGDKLVVVGDDQDVSVARFNLTIQPTQSSDFDGDGFSDYVIFRPSTTNWFVLRSSDQSVQTLQFGSSGDVPIDGDFDGDGKSDLAIYRPSLGQWWHQKSSSGTVFAAQFGQAGDKPVPGDYDKDGKTDIANWRPSTGNYFILRSSDNFASFFAFPFGQNGDIPVGTAIFP